jgi:hypothetical protein
MGIFQRKNLFSIIACIVPMPIIFILLRHFPDLTLLEYDLICLLVFAINVYMGYWVYNSREVITYKVIRPSEIFKNITPNCKQALANFIMGKALFVKIMEMICPPKTPQWGATEDPEVVNPIQEGINDGSSSSLQPSLITSQQLIDRDRNHGFDTTTSHEGLPFWSKWREIPILNQFNYSPPLHETCITTSHENIVRKIKKSLGVIYFDSGMFCNVVPMGSGVWLMPRHVIPTNGAEKAKIVGFGPRPLVVFIWRSNTHYIGPDLALVRIDKIGSIPSLANFLPEELLPENKKLTCNMVYTEEKGTEMIVSRAFDVRPGHIISSYQNFDGLKYTLPFTTFQGLCMGVIIARGNKKAHIAGFHLAGDGILGGGANVTRNQVLEGIDLLIKQIPGALHYHEAQSFNPQLAETNCGPITPVHKKCPTNDLPPGSELKIIGGHTLPRASPSTNVETSILSNHVTRIMGIEKIHGPPESLGHPYHKLKDLSDKANVFWEYSEISFRRAWTDYSRHIMGSIPVSQLRQIKILDKPENTCGLDGVLGINAIDWTTSQGFGYKGPKSLKMIETTETIEGITDYKLIDNRIWKEVERMEDILASGRRINTVFKACLKDEPVVVGSDKVRVFAACNFPMVMLVRKYFLSHCALIQRNQIIFESAVGIVTQSPEWTKLYDYVTKFGEGRAVAGDYSGFDRRMSPKFMMGAFKILVDLAEASDNYTKRDLKIMTGIVCEIIQPHYDYFGTLVQFFGSNPSGSPVTVVINSLVNCLYLRYAYYEIYPKSNLSFRKVCAAMTYGDDVVATVNEKFPKYNHTKIQKVFAASGMKFTMPDKVSESIPYVDFGSVSFLKCYWKWDPELKVFRSPCELSSIQKMLHVRVSSQLSRDHAACEAIKNVSLRYFEFGREIYDKRTRELEQVVVDSGLRGMIDPLPSYDERLAWYREKFKDDLPAS